MKGDNDSNEQSTRGSRRREGGRKDEGGRKEASATEGEASATEGGIRDGRRHPRFPSSSFTGAA